VHILLGTLHGTSQEGKAPVFYKSASLQNLTMLHAQQQHPLLLLIRVLLLCVAAWAFDRIASCLLMLHRCGVYNMCIICCSDL
jgi:hypothetical protein